MGIMSVVAPQGDSYVPVGQGKSMQDCLERLMVWTLQRERLSVTIAVKGKCMLELKNQWWTPEVIISEIQVYPFTVDTPADNLPTLQPPNRVEHVATASEYSTNGAIEIPRGTGVS